MLVDVDVPRAELVRLSRGLTPARLARVIAMLDPVELMFALKKLRARRAPANQAHVTNLKENPALLAADAAEAAARGFAEVETTVGVSRYAPLNAIAILVGSQTGRPGVLTQCAVEERLNLRLAIQGLVTYAETLSVYGTEAVFVDGDDTPWSKAFLASAYASRGVKVRFTSGGGSEALMGESEGKSMLYLEARCLSLVRAAGSQGVQNGSISCVALALAVPGRHARGARRERARRVARPRGRLGQRRDREPLGDPQDGEADGPVPARAPTSSRPATRRCRATTTCSAAATTTRDDLDEWLTIQRDWQVDAGIEPLDEAERARRARARRARGAGRVRRVRLPADHRRGGAARDDVPRLARPARPRPRGRRRRRPTACSPRASAALDVARALDERGFADVADAVFGMQRQRVAADYLQTSAIIAPDGTVVSAVNDANALHRARARATGSRASAGSGCSGCRTRSTRACSARRRARRAVGRGARPGRARRRGRTRS